jgi:D-sedoheptulose 7-phosphate isomerase
MDGGHWIGGFVAALDNVTVTDRDQIHVGFNPAIYVICQLLDEVKAKKRRIFFVGNGGSAGICSHMAADWLKNGRFAAMAFNDPASLTCLANDLGYQYVFSEPLGFFGYDGDVLFAISSSGKSPNIITAASAANDRKMHVVTLTGFDADNPLRRMGGINFYVPEHQYGYVECAHQCILHAILDIQMQREQAKGAIG